MRMLFLILVSSLSLASGISLAETASRNEGPIKLYYSPNQHLKVTVSTINGITTVLDVAQGVFLSVSSPSALECEPEKALELPQTIRGTVSLFIGREDEVATGEGMSGDTIMARSPLKMTVENAVVVIARAE